MDFLDMRTVMFSHLLVDLITFVVTLLWIQNRGRFNGTGLWAVDFAFRPRE